MSFLVRVVVSAIAIWLTALWVPGIDLTRAERPVDQVVVALVVGLVFALINAIIKPIVQVLAFPVYLLTLGLFGLVVNALLLMLTGWITRQIDWGLAVDGFWPAFWGAIVIALISFVLSLVLPDGRDRRRR